MHFYQMRSRTALAAVFLLISQAIAQETGSINTATITDATKQPETPTSVPAVTSPSTSDAAPTPTISNPVVVVAPGAAIVSTAGAPSITTDLLTTDVVKPTVVAAVIAQDLFAQIAYDNPASVLNGPYTHPVTPAGVASEYQGSSGLPIATNNYYGNLMLGDQTQPVYVMPYSVYWRQGSGLCAWNTDSTQYQFQSNIPSTQTPQYYYSPVGNCPIGFSATEMTSAQTLTTSKVNHQSVDAVFAPGSGSGTMTVPLVQGNAFLTSIYKGLTPQLFGGAFTSLTGVTFKSGSAGSAGSKYRVTINNGDTWLVYLFPQTPGSVATLTLTSTTTLTGPSGYSGVIQIAKLPLGFADSDESAYDSAAGTYASQNVISGTSSGNAGTYTFNFGAVSLAGNPLLSYLYPHQVSSVSSGTATSLKLWSNTKGRMQAFLGNTLSFTETDLPIDIQFLPWSPLGNLQNYSIDALQAIAQAANLEVQQVFSQQTNLNSMYYAGKALAKFAQICLTIHDVLGKDASSCVTELEASMATFVNNQNIYPLVYDVVWKGAISSCGDQGCDFGNAWYNDHHFHYGYFVYTAAVLGHLDPSWLTSGNKAYINTLVRDFANPSTTDTAFPQFRMFDWYAGHSWAAGIIVSGDGKNEESSSEDYNAIYGMKLWGNIIGDSSMEARGNLMLALMRRSMQTYMLMEPDNTVEPSRFVPQLAAGITYMNKIDHTTFFGSAEQYIHGIHMLPLTPISAYIRSPAFVADEWTLALEPIISSVTDGWLGVLMANYAIANSTASYNFFTSGALTSAQLDGGASMTWYLTYAAGLGGAGDFDLAVDSNGAQASTSVVIKSASSTATTYPHTAINVMATQGSQSLGSSSSAVVSTAASRASVASLASSAFASSVYSSIVSSSAVGSTAQQSNMSPSTTPTPVVTAYTSSTSASASDVHTVSSATPSTSASAIDSPHNSQAPPGPSATLVTLSLPGAKSVSCPGDHLMVGDYADVVTIYDNGTLACGSHRAFILPNAQMSSVYSIELDAVTIVNALRSVFSLNGTTLTAYAYMSRLARRQDTSVTAQPLTFAYGSDNVLVAVVPGSNTTMTTVTPSAVIISSVSSTPVSANSLATASSAVNVNAQIPSATVSSAPLSSTMLGVQSAVIPGTSSLVPTTGTGAAIAASTGQMVSSSLVSSTGTGAALAASTGQMVSSSLVSSTGTGAAIAASTGQTVSQTSDMPTVAGSSVSGISLQGASSNGSTPAYSNAQAGNATGQIGAQQPQVSTLVTNAAVPTTKTPMEYSTVSYSTSVNGQATIVTTVVPISTVLVVQTQTKTICKSCATTAAAIVPGSSAQGDGAVGSTNVPVGSSSTSGGTASTSDNSGSTSDSSNVAASGSSDTETSSSSNAQTSGTNNADTASASTSTSGGNTNVSNSDENSSSTNDDTTTVGTTGSDTAAAAGTAAGTDNTVSTNDAANAATTGSGTSSAAVSQGMPIVSTTALPVSTNGGDRLFMSLTSLLGFLMIFLL